MSKPVSIPPYFCILPFIHLSSRPSGEARICCYTQTRGKITNTDNHVYKWSDDIADIWNSDYLNKIRSKMLNGESCDNECRLCYEEEKYGNISKRILQNKAHEKEVKYVLEYYSKTKNIPNINIRDIDLRFGNKCNLKCRTCSGVFSSSIENEAYEKYKDNFFYKSDHIQNKDDLIEWYKKDTFFKNIHKIYKYLTNIYITGGEPVIIPEVKKILLYLIEHDVAKNITIRMNTNLSVFDKEFFDLLLKFKKIKLNPSIDIIGDKLSYMRHPLKWKKFNNNLERIINYNFDTVLNCTVSLYNILYLPELHQFYNSKYKLPISYNILHSPDFMSITILPKTLKIKAIDNLKKYIAENNYTLSKKNVEEWDTLMKMLESPSNQKTEKLLKLFTEYTNYIDKIRRESFTKTFPELKSIIGYKDFV